MTIAECITREKGSWLFVHQHCMLGVDRFLWGFCSHQSNSRPSAFFLALSLVEMPELQGLGLSPWVLLGCRWSGPAGAELCAASTSSCLGNRNSHSPRISLKEQACMLWKTVLLEKEDFCFEWCMAVVRQGMLIPWNCQKNASAN